MAASGLVIAPRVALALGVALLGWAWWGEQRPDAPPPAATPRLTLPLAAPGVRPTAVGVAVAPASPVQPAPTAAAVDLPALLAAPGADLRATLQAALAAQARGGRLYARALARRCADLAGLQPAAAPDRNDARHQRAVTRHAALAAGCGQFAGPEWLALVNIAPGEPGAGDPLLAVQQSDLDDTPLLRAVVAHPDPLLLDELGERLLRRRLDGQPVLYFDGQRFDDDASRATAQAALRLLPCEFGLTCDERDPEVWLACLRGDGCVASRADGATAQARALAARLAAALRAGELGRFLPPPA
ncbi:hypothetical protein ACG04Q_05710 [Roseateles sp. DXS20W]|uniref:Uncharacterized protein n=1 Tax=Pelomonas lactea TaxID=3299030 RepID=A0ABW7GGI3_9BURK